MDTRSEMQHAINDDRSLNSHGGVLKRKSKMEEPRSPLMSRAGLAGMGLTKKMSHIGNKNRPLI